MRPLGAAGGDSWVPDGAHIAYGETKAPSEVDTLRDEACPICGETDAWSGDVCKVCGFVAPPSKFQDPDVDMHKQLDLHDKDDQDVDDLNADINDQDKDGLDDNTGEPVGDQQPMLTCPNCGYEVAAGEPQTVSTEDSTMGDASEVSPGPSAGDLCPNCGKVPLMSPEEMAEAGLGADPDEGDINEGVHDPDEDSDSPFGDKEDDSSDDDDPEDEHDHSDDDEEDEEDDNSFTKKTFPPKKK